MTSSGIFKYSLRVIAKHDANASHARRDNKAARALPVIVLTILALYLCEPEMVKGSIQLSFT